MRSPVSVRIVISAPGTLLRAIGLIAVGSMVPSQGASSPISSTIVMTVAPNTTLGLRSNLRNAAGLPGLAGREARLQLALATRGSRLPTIRAVCEDESRARRAVLRDGLPRGPCVDRRRSRPVWRPRPRAGRSALDLVDTLVEIHAVDVRRAGCRRLRSPRELPRAAGAPVHAALEINQTRDLPEVVEVGDWLAATCPSRRRSPSSTATTGSEHDGRGDSPTSSRCSTGRWARSAIPAPTSATCSPRTPSRAATRIRSAPRPSPRRRASRRSAELVERYAERSGRDVEPLAWFQALALWKAAVFCEAIYGRFIRGELAAEDTNAARFEQGVPFLAEAAAAALAR